MGHVWDIYEKDMEHKAIKNPDFHRDFVLFIHFCEILVE